MTYTTVAVERPRLAIPAPRRPSLYAFAPRPRVRPAGQLPTRDPDTEQPRIRIGISMCGDHTLVSLAGDLDILTHDVIHRTLLGLLAQAGPRLVLDLGGVHFADARGISPLLAASRAAARSGGWVRLIRVHDRVQLILDILRLTEKLPTYDTVAGALADTARLRTHESDAE